MQIVRSLVSGLYILAFSISARLLFTSSWLSPSNFFIKGPRSARLQIPSSKLLHRFYFHYHSDNMHQSTVPAKRPSGSTNEPSPKAFKIDATENKKRFIQVFDDVVDELLGILKAEAMPDEIVAWYERVGS